MNTKSQNIQIVFQARHRSYKTELFEFRHDIFHDVDGLGEELTQVVAAAIAEAHEKGELVLTRETTN